MSNCHNIYSSSPKSKKVCVSVSTNRMECGHIYQLDF